MDARPSAVARARSRGELEAAIPDILAAPKLAGAVEMIVVRPAAGLRETPGRVGVSLEGGVAGDHWAKGCWRTTDAGEPHPDVQICMMSARTIRAIAGEPEHWPAAGDNLFLDMDLSPANMPPGTRFAIGTAGFVVTAEPHDGCQSFIDRYGRDACLFVNTGRGRALRLRGIYARVTRDGEIAVGDRVLKLA